MSSINQKYLEIVLAYLSVLEEKELQLTQFNGKDAYLFHCPHCTKYVHSIKGKQRKTAKLIRTGGNSWVFSCSRGYSIECRGGAKSFHNFLAMLNPDLFSRYRKELATLWISVGHQKFFYGQGIDRSICHLCSLMEPTEFKLGYLILGLYWLGFFGIRSTS